MKKTSILLTVLLVVSLLFAVSCPNKDPLINVTSDKSAIEKNLQGVDKNISINVTIDIAHDTFSDKVATAASVIDWFTLSDGTETEKATLTSATVSSVSEKKDSVTVALVAEAKGVTEASKPVKLTVAIPEATSDAVWTTSKKAIKETNANAIAITIVDKSSVKASITSGNPVSFTIGQADVEKNVTVTLENGTFANKDGITVTRADGAEISHMEFKDYTIGTGANANELSITVKSLTDIAQEDGGAFKINIPSSAITPSSDDYVKTDLSVALTVGVNSGILGQFYTDRFGYVWLTSEGTISKTNGTQEDVYFADFPFRVRGYKFKDSLLGTSVLLDENQFNLSGGQKKLYVTQETSNWGNSGYLIKDSTVKDTINVHYYIYRMYVNKSQFTVAEQFKGGKIHISPDALIPDDGFKNFYSENTLSFVLWGKPITIVCDDANTEVKQGESTTITFTMTGGTWNIDAEEFDEGNLVINDDESVSQNVRVENEGFAYSFSKDTEDASKLNMTITANADTPVGEYNKKLLAVNIYNTDFGPILPQINSMYSPCVNWEEYYEVRGNAFVNETPFKLTVTAK